MNDSFVTQTDAEYLKKQLPKVLIGCFIVGTLLACIGFVVAWQTFLFFESVFIIAWVITVIKKVRENRAYELRFENDTLYITNLATGDVYTVYDIPASDFIINQTKKEKSLDYCSLSIKNTIFNFGGVKSYSDLIIYITEHYRAV